MAPQNDSLLPLGGQHGMFMTTRWSRVVAAGGKEDDGATKALAELCRDYWKPLYYFARRKGQSPEDAQDLTQGFIVELLESQSFARANQSLGRFRSFLIGAFCNYMAAEHRNRTALKRGGGKLAVSLDDPEVEASYALEDATTPELLYERSWAMALLERVMQRLQEEYTKAGRQDLYEMLQPHIAGGGPGYAQIAEKLGTNESALAVSMHRMRKRYRELLHGAIAETVEFPADIEDELRHLMTVVS